MSEQEFYRSKAFYIHADNFADLCKQLNEFARDKWVIAWQIFCKADFTEMHAIVTYKWKE